MTNKEIELWHQNWCKNIPRSGMMSTNALMMLKDFANEFDASKMKIEFHEGQISDTVLDGQVATIKLLPGLSETGETQTEAFAEVIKSIAVLLAHNTGLDNQVLNNALALI